jgi:hypothetical protein
MLVCIIRDRWSIAPGCWLLARAEVVEARRDAVEIGDRPGIVECATRR